MMCCQAHQQKKKKKKRKAISKTKNKEMEIINKEYKSLLTDQVFAFQADGQMTRRQVAWMAGIFGTRFLWKSSDPKDL